MAEQDTTPKKAVRYSAYHIEVPFLDHLDILVEPTPEAPLLVVDLKRMHMNGGGRAHGGLIMTLLDMAMAAAARNGDSGGGRFGVTVEMKTNFLRPGGSIGGRLSARGKLRHASRSLAFCDGELLDAEGQLVATASGTFKFVSRPKGDDAP
ncbi:PaaI family thioesterase [Pseudomonas sp. B392_1p]|uniref:PaaI family thioesterase n=1 Tax=Pseudomonas sp. B392_1p TaxID=3457507 RepID=UPI003FCFDD60